MNNFSNILALAHYRNNDFISIKKSITLAKKNHAHITVLLTRKKHSIKHQWLNKVAMDNFTNEKQIISLINNAKHEGVSICYKIREERDQYIALKSQLENTKYDLVVAEHKKEGSWLWPFKKTEYSSLLSASDTSILFVGDHQWLDKGNVLAAIETEESTFSHRKFNDEIIAKASDLAKLLVSDIHLFNCYWESCSMSFKDIESAKINIECSNHLEHLTALVKKYHFKDECLHVEEGLADDIIPHQANKLNANVVVIGCGEHKGWLSKIKGHTIDYVLDNLKCDLLAMKQSHFH